MAIEDSPWVYRRMWEECARENRELLRRLHYLEEENRRLKLLVIKVLEEYPELKSYFTGVDLSGVEEKTKSYREIAKRLKPIENMVLRVITELYEIRKTPLTYSDIISYLTKRWARARGISERIAYGELAKMDVKRLIRKLAQEGKIIRVENGLFAPIKAKKNEIPTWLKE